MDYWLQLDIEPKQQIEMPTTEEEVLPPADNWLQESNPMLAATPVAQLQVHQARSNHIQATQLKFAPTNNGFSLVRHGEMVPVQSGDIVETPLYLATVTITKLAKEHNTQSVLAPVAPLSQMTQLDQFATERNESMTTTDSLGFLNRNNNLPTRVAQESHQLMPSAFQLPSYKPQTALGFSANDPNTGQGLNFDGVDSMAPMGPAMYDDMQMKSAPSVGGYQSPLDEIESIFADGFDRNFNEQAGMHMQVQKPKPDKTPSLLTGLGNLRRVFSK